MGCVGGWIGNEVAAMVGSAYECTVVDYKLKTTETKRQRTECATVSDAQQRLLDGQRVVVAGSDMGQLRSRLAAWGVEG